jgi:hypothetical protein
LQQVEFEGHAGEECPHRKIARTLQQAHLLPAVVRLQLDSKDGLLEIIRSIFFRKAISTVSALHIEIV